ncbi:single myb histone 6-like protein [Cinnamomum micranthum f. kanehirae]|uniref:Single myb histone 6-like protein n=1 Tax=Cinnamomum micranthum f. kanehirae TaxID=337451 RepID=A0A3S3NB93_9MAGN|nr:single myb histone 6-like protein [Cinnamomum micranthum f. kanehirae]
MINGQIKEWGWKGRLFSQLLDQYFAPPNFKRLLSAKLKALTTCGKLMKVKRKYRIAPSIVFSEGRSSGLLLLEGRPRESFKVEKDDFKPLTKSQIDSDLAKMRNMTAQEAAAAAAEAVAEAEAALAEAEEAAREAEAAEADAEAAQGFAEAAMMELKNRNTSKLMVSDEEVLDSAAAAAAADSIAGSWKKGQKPLLLHWLLKLVFCDLCSFLCCNVESLFGF